jgi:hypothetical protein
MTPWVITVPETASLTDIARLMERHGINRVPGLRDGRLVGIVSRSNLLQATTDVSKDVNADERTIRERLTAEVKAQGWALMLTKTRSASPSMPSLPPFRSVPTGCGPLPGTMPKVTREFQSDIVLKERRGRRALALDQRCMT